MQEQDKAGGVRLVEVDSDRDGQRIDNFLSARLRGLPRSLVYRLIRTGQVRINGKRCKPATRLSVGDTVRIPPAPRASGEAVRVPESACTAVRAAVLHEDDDLLVVDKPAGMAVHAGSGLDWGLIDALRQDRPGQFLEEPAGPREVPKGLLRRNGHRRDRPRASGGRRAAGRSALRGARSRHARPLPTRRSQWRRVRGASPSSAPSCCCWLMVW